MTVTSSQQIEQEAAVSNSRNTYTAILRPELRPAYDKLVADLVANSLAGNATLKDAMDSGSFSRELFIRSTIESVLRIELMRKVNPLACVRVSQIDPILCKQWGLYAADEGLHGRLFAKDLHEVGVTDEEIYNTPLLFATELLAGYLYHTLAEEGPLGVITSAYYVESVAGMTQPSWLQGMEQVVGREATRGAHSHLHIDEKDGHVDLAWNMCMRLVKTPEDEARFKQHIIKLHSLFVAYAIEVATLVATRSREKAMADVGPAAIAASAAAQTQKPF
jgi:hypothetical protein